MVSKKWRSRPKGTRRGKAYVPVVKPPMLITPTKKSKVRRVTSADMNYATMSTLTTVHTAISLL